MPSSFATRAIGRDVSITILTASSLNSDEKLFLGRGNYFTFPEVHPNGWTVRKLRGTPDGAVCLQRSGLLDAMRMIVPAVNGIRATEAPWYLGWPIRPRAREDRAG